MVRHPSEELWPKRRKKCRARVEDLGTQEPASFENALEELETVVEQLEGGELTLEESLALYERGIAFWRSLPEIPRCRRAESANFTSRDDDDALDDYDGADHDG